MENKENSYAEKILEAENFLAVLSDLPDSEENRQHLKKFEDIKSEFKKLELRKIENDHEKDNQMLLIKVLGICDKQVSRIEHYVGDCNNFIDMSDMLMPTLNEEEKSLLMETKESFNQLKEHAYQIRNSFGDIMSKKVVNDHMVSGLKSLDKELTALENNLSQIKNCYFSLSKLAQQSNSTRETLKIIPDNYMNGFNDRLKNLSKRILNIENQSLKGSFESLNVNNKTESENLNNLEDHRLVENSMKRLSMTSQMQSKRKSEHCKHTLRPVRMNSTLVHQNPSENLSPQAFRRVNETFRGPMKNTKDTEIEYLIDKLNYFQNKIKITQRQLSDAIKQQNDTINDQINMALSTRNFNSRFLQHDGHFYEEEDTPIDDILE